MTDYSSLAAKFGGQSESMPNVDYSNLAQKFGGQQDLGATNAPVRLDAIEEPNWIEKQLARITLPKAAEWGLNQARGFVMGAADPSVGAFQLAANAIGQGDAVNNAIAKKEAEYQADRKAVGRDGFDATRMVGNVASPVNLIAASRIATPASTGGRVLLGAELGAAGAAAEPITDGGANYWGNKAGQVVTGAALGGMATPLIGKLGDAISKRMSMATRSAELADPASAASQNAAANIDKVITEALQDIGQTAHDLPPNTIQSLRDQVAKAMAQGNMLDPAAILRKQDFEAVGAKPLLGQITRDPMQFASELNLRGVANVGEPIANRLAEQNQLLQGKLNSLRSGADESFNAGTQIANTLKGADDTFSKYVSGLYQKARQDAGKDLDVPLTGLAQDFAEVLHNFGDKVPSGVVNQFKALGLDPLNPSNQKKLFTIEDADKLLKVINSHVGSDAPTNRALDLLRGAVKNSVLSADATGGPFAPAVQAAAQRFQLHDAVPALKAAAEGSVAPDDFVRRFIINGKTNDVNGLANVLKISDPAAYDQARAQIGAQLYRAAFGEDVVGTKGFSAERFNKALRDLGTDKLKAFFNADEVAQIKTLGRVGAYIHQAPAGSAVNSSNTAGAMVNLLNRIPGAPAPIAIANAVKNTVNNASTVSKAVAAEPPVTPMNLSDLVSPEGRARLAKLLSFGAAGIGGLGGALFR